MLICLLLRSKCSGKFGYSFPFLSCPLGILIALSSSHVVDIKIITRGYIGYTSHLLGDPSRNDKPSPLTDLITAVTSRFFVQWQLQLQLHRLPESTHLDNCFTPIREQLLAFRGLSFSLLHTLPNRSLITHTPYPAPKFGIKLSSASRSHIAFLSFVCETLVFSPWTSSATSKSPCSRTKRT